MKQTLETISLSYIINERLGHVKFGSRGGKRGLKLLRDWTFEMNGENFT